MIYRLLIEIKDNTSTTERKISFKNYYLKIDQSVIANRFKILFYFQEWNSLMQEIARRRDFSSRRDRYCGFPFIVVLGIPSKVGRGRKQDWKEHEGEDSSRARFSETRS